MNVLLYQLVSVLLIPHLSSFLFSALLFELLGKYLQWKKHPWTLSVLIYGEIRLSLVCVNTYVALCSGIKCTEQFFCNFPGRSSPSCCSLQGTFTRLSPDGQKTLWGRWCHCLIGLVEKRPRRVQAMEGSVRASPCLLIPAAVLSRQQPCGVILTAAVLWSRFISKGNGSSSLKCWLQRRCCCQLFYLWS